MSRLDELINEFCPDGVEYKAICEFCKVGTGKSNRQDADENGEYPFYVRSKEVFLNNSYEFDEEAIIIPGEGSIGEIFHYVNGKYALHQRAYRIHIEDNYVITKFLYYYMSQNFKKFIYQKAVNATVKSIRKPMIEKFVVPIPPLPVQREIVRILDNFTELTAELTAELTEELIARKKQYEYYRDSLLTFGGDVPMMRLGDIATDIYRGSGIKRDEITTAGIPCVRYGEIYTTYNVWFDQCVSHTVEEKIVNRKYFEHGDVLFAITGESVEDIAKSCVYMGQEKCLAGGDLVVMKHNQNPKYIGYALSTTSARIQKSKGRVKSKVVHSNVTSISDIVIPIPSSIKEQERIVDILDRFDALCNDMTIGLPAEIEARQKQYEYYRDKLLSFKEKK